MSKNSIGKAITMEKHMEDIDPTVGIISYYCRPSGQSAYIFLRTGILLNFVS
jgi:hypothetical protein